MNLAKKKGTVAMNRKEFGRLISLLRAELGWTQSQLAEYAEIPVTTLSNIERGVKKFLEPKTLFRLANVLQLTSLERREFFLASCGLEQKQLVRPSDQNSPLKDFDVQKTLGGLMSMLSNMYAPAHLGDAFGDVIAVNHIMLDLLQITPESLHQAANSPAGINNMHIIYGMMEVHQAFGDQFNNAALISLRAFRESSLRYRTKPRFFSLMKEFRNIKKYPLFDQYWRKSSVLEDDKEAMLSPFEISHDIYGRLRITSSSSVILTPYGELYLSHYFPLDHTTATAFIKIADKVGQGVKKLTPWPNKTGRT